tara:strand:+ start:577 stop:873 length:297 start_codon:yes stop_codon:yes gene_type:complete
MRLDPCNRFLHVSLVEVKSEKESEKSQVLLPDDYLQEVKQRYRTATLLGVGEQCTVFTDDDIGNVMVVVDATMLESFVDSSGEEQFFILESHILGTYR